MEQNRVTLAGSRRPAPAGAREVGKPDPQDTVNVTIVIRRRAPLPDNKNLGAVVSRDEFAEKYGASPADIRAVREFAEQHSLNVEEVHEARRTLVVSGTVANMETAFGTELRNYQRDNETFRARSGDLTLPSELSGIIQGVFGLDERPQARSHMRLFSSIRPHAETDVSYAPPAVAALYDYPSGATGAGQTIGLIELGGGYKKSDLKTYFSNLGITEPKVSAVSVDKAKNKPAGDPNSADGEVLLDIEVAGSIAPGAAIVVYFTPNTTQGFLDAITTAVHDTKHKVDVISISWGGPEASWTAQAMTSYDQAFQDARALGVTVCVASGDDGSSDNETDGQAHVDFPASSPNVLACGGTSLQSSGNSITNETVWNDGSGQGASGGGVSEVFPLPDYQTSADVPVSVNSTKFKGRGVPDVAGDADPATGYNVTVDGQSIVVGGTSAVAPLWAALVALVNQQLGKPVGFINTALYGNPNAGEFHDITSGNNGAYSAKAGWDACTGWGSPDGAALLRLLEGSA